MAGGPPDPVTATPSETPDAIAPDGIEVRLLPRLRGGSMAHFRLPAGRVSRAVTHRTVEEIWFFLDGEGEMWRAVAGSVGEVTPVRRGVAVTIPLGTAFQVRVTGDGALDAVAITMPPWPGDDEAVLVDGAWPT
jgi:mannose-6-phosphate isomerase-like protein (cupin superfamily)